MVYLLLPYAKKIIEILNKKFLENGEVSRSEEQC